jgi:glyoxylase-like metal-dependent hydrolase (beta-lactamase superfamily II)
MINVQIIVSGQIEVNCYLIYDSITLKTLIVDPGEEGDKVISEIDKNNLKPEMLINTHSHFDHILSDEQIRNHYKIPLAAHTESVDNLADPQKNASAFFSNSISVKKPEILLEDNQIISVSFTKFQVIHTPGHTNDSICLLFDNFLITGDTLFAGDVGRTDLRDGSQIKLNQSLLKLKNLSPSLIIYPGHAESSVLSYELKHNPYLIEAK